MRFAYGTRVYVFIVLHSLRFFRVSFRVRFIVRYRSNVVVVDRINCWRSPRIRTTVTRWLFRARNNFCSRRYCRVHRKLYTYTCVRMYTHDTYPPFALLVSFSRVLVGKPFFFFKFPEKVTQRRPPNVPVAVMRTVFVRRNVRKRDCAG